MIYFDTKNLFANVLLNEPIKIILQKEYEGKKIKIAIPSALKKLLYLCTKYVHSFLLTRDAFPAEKNRKERSPKVFNKYTKSYFSNIGYGRSPDQ